MHTVLICPVSSVQLVFGLRWMPLLSGRATGAARRIARQRKATHMVLDGNLAAAFGYGRLPPRTRKSGLLHSAAQNMARLYPEGSIAAMVSLGSHGYWLVAVQEGAVMTRTDRVFSTYEQAIAALRDLQRGNRRLEARIDAEAPSLHDLAAASHSGTALRSTGYQHRRWALWLTWAVVIVASLVFIKKLFSPSIVAPEPTLEATEINARWNQALEQLEQRIIIHGVAATYALLRHLYELPVQMAGWALAKVTCSAQLSDWQCIADYDRRHRHANNQTILDHAPASWRLSFTNMDRAVAAWTFTHPLPVPAQWQVKDAAYNQRHLQSSWQSIKPLFSRMTLGPPQPISIEAPSAPDGLPLARPAGLQTYARRAVELESPLRSLSVLLPYTQAIGWRTVSLTVSDNVPPSSTTSRLKATLQGDLYERYELAATVN